MAQFMQHFHSGWRWIVVLLLVVILVKYLLGWLGKQEFTGLDRRLSMWFGMAYFIQIILGVILLVLRGEYAAYQLEHIFTLLLPVVLVMVPARFKNADSLTRFRSGFFVYLGIAFFIYLGVARVGGWA